MPDIRRTVQRSKPCWWVTGRKKDGKMALLGPFDSEETASSTMMDAFPNDTGRTHLMFSSDRSRITQQLKYLLFNESHDLDSSMQPFSHINK